MMRIFFEDCCIIRQCRKKQIHQKIFYVFQNKILGSLEGTGKILFSLSKTVCWMEKMGPGPLRTVVL